MRLRVSLLVVSAFVLVGASACGSGGPKPASNSTAGSGAVATPTAVPVKLTVSYGATDPSYLWLLSAKDGGYFQKNGLDVTLQAIPGPQAIAALLSGQIQEATGGGGETLSAAVEGGDLVVLAMPQPHFPGKIYASQNIKTIEDLKGKKVGITSPGGTYDVLLRTELTKHGLQPDKDVTFISTGSIPNATAALLSEAVDGIAASIGPESTKIEAGGFHGIDDLSTVELGSANVVMQRAYVSSHHDVAQRFIDSVVETIAREKKDKAFTVAELQKFTQINDQTTLNAIYDYYLGQEQIAPALPEPKADYLKLQLDLLAIKNEKARGFDASKIVDSSFVDSAATRGLNKQ